MRHKVKLLYIEGEEFSDECRGILEDIVGRCDDVELFVRDIRRHKGEGEYYGVKSVPTVVIDGEVRFVGCPPAYVLENELL